jgi:Protein of unknown function (DUF2971)
MMLFRYIGAKNGIEAKKILQFFCEDHTMRVSNPTSFNDPHEFKVNIDFDATDAIRRQRFLADNPGSPTEDFVDWERGLTEQFFLSLRQTTRAKVLDQSGVVCLSDRGEDPLMWSHYASHHQGFCVGFDETLAEKFDDVVGAGFVNYVDRAPLFRYFSDPPEEFERYILSYKSSVWKHEHEYRIVFNKQGIRAFPSSALLEITLGCQAFPELVQFAQERCEEQPLQFWQMCEDLNSYRFFKTVMTKGAWPMSSHFRKPQNQGA